MPTIRSLKVASSIQYVLTQNIKEVFAFDKALLDTMITITKVNLSSDLKIANCYIVASLMSQVSIDLILAKFNKVKHVFRQRVNKALMLKHSPEIRFFYDYTINNVDKINQILDSINKQD
jgi:ribosome-binding factor A